MRLRPLAWRALYELLGARVRRPEWAFMNYGYAPPTVETGTALALDQADEVDRLCIQLYEHATAGIDLTGLDVLEVGSGRGGGSSYLSRYRHPRSMTGLDYSASAVALSARDRGRPGLTFVRGDAQAMPFPDSVFDAVVNVESSHCYGSMPAFLSEVYRVLRPGGTFCWVDLRGRDDVDTLHNQLDSSPLTVSRREDITDEVLRALRLDTRRKDTLIDTYIPRVFHRPFRRFAAVQGSRTYDSFDQGTLRYLSATLVRTATA